MEPEKIKAIYDELGTLFVKVEPEPERGLTYIRERLTMCRAMQDRVAELRLMVNRELSDVMESLLITQHLHSLAPSPKTKEDLSVFERRKQGLALVGKMIGAQSQVLGRTAQDIKLLSDITRDMIKRGEYNPNDSPGLISEVPITDLANPPEVAEPQFPEMSTEPSFEGYVDVLAESAPTTVGASRVGFTAPAASEPQPLTLPDTKTVNFDDLFKTPEDTNHGAASPVF